MLSHYLVAEQMAWLGRPWAALRACWVVMAKVQVAAVAAAVVAAVAGWRGLDMSL